MLSEKELNEKELKHFSRSELLEILISQGKKIERLQSKIDELTSKLEDRDFSVSQAGSIAEASLRVNGVYEAAQNAADQYLVNVKRLCEEKLAEADEAAQRKIDEANAIIKKMRDRLVENGEKASELNELLDTSADKNENAVPKTSGSKEEMEKKLITLAKAQAKEEKKKKKSE